MKNYIKFIAFSAIFIAVFGVSISVFPVTADAAISWGDYYGYNKPTYVYDFYNYHSSPVYYPVAQPVYYQQPIVYSYPSYPAITASCFADRTTSYTRSNVEWYVTASGGNGSYSYVWSGTEDLVGRGTSVTKKYYNPGIKTASVIVGSGSQSINVACSNSINVLDDSFAIRPIYYQQPVVVQASPTYVVAQNNVANNLDIGCYADPISVSSNQPVTWSAEVSGGSAPYTYSWSGSDNLSGNQSSILKYYSSTGDKSAIVTVTSADGKTGTRACSNAVAVRPSSTYASASRTVAPAQTVTTNNDEIINNRYSAAALFSLSNVPWGWVAVLVILVLFATVLYLIFNRKKI